MILRQPEEINLRRVIEVREELVAVKMIVMHKIERRPKQIRNKHRLKSSPQKFSVAERLVKVHAVKHSERRDKKEDRHAKARDDFKERDEVYVRRGIEEVLRAGVYRYDSRHAHAANIFD